MSAVEISIDARVDPPAITLSEQEASLTLSLDITARHEGADRAPLVLAVIPVCAHPDGPLKAHLGQAIAGLITHLGDEDVILGEGGRSLTVDADPEGMAWSSPQPTITKGLEAGYEALKSFAGVPVARRVTLVVSGMTHEGGEALTRAATQLSQANIGIDVLVVSMSSDLGLLNRLANLGGGALMVATELNELSAPLARRLPALQGQRVLNPKLELSFPHGVQPGDMFRLAPTRAFLGAVRVSHTERRLMLDPGPMGDQSTPRFLMTMVIPRRVAGMYRVCTAKLSWSDQGRASEVEHEIVVSVDQPGQQRLMAQSPLVIARDRVELLSWVEDMGRAQADGEHRRVSNLLERLTRRLNELSEIMLAEQVGGIRRAYLRSGSLNMVELNQMRHAMLSVNRVG
ncbi:MAG: hypothetical protein ACE366_10430 [Bradymonadia bacterium]